MNILILNLEKSYINNLILKIIKISNENRQLLKIKYNIINLLNEWKLNLYYWNEEEIKKKNS